MEVSILITGTRHMRDLNAKYRGVDRVTDVLSFSQAEGVGPRGPAGVLLGDVVICANEARSQAEEAGEGIDGALARLTVHGILHLLGYDHEGSPAEARRMRALERRFLEPPPQKKPVRSSRGR